MFKILTVCLLAISLPFRCDGHGRLLEPPGRSSLWRFGFDAPTNYNDNELYCGGYNDQWIKHDGQCGVCGDPYEDKQPRANEAGGTYGLGIIARNYVEGQVIDIHVELTTNHKGWFEFRICPNNDIHKIVTQECLDQRLLEIEEWGTRFYIDDSYPRECDINLKAKLPKGLTCSQCVVQWNYNTASNWGTCDNGTQAMGCGPQETFRGCADVSIY